MVTPGKLARRAEFFEQLASMIAAGVSLPKALEMIGRNRTSGLPPKLIQGLIARLNDGHTFTDAMQLVSGQLRGEPGVDVSIKPRRELWLSDFDMALLSAGEQSGQLDSAFRLLARYCASQAKIIRDTVTGLIFTMVTLHVFLFIMPLFLLVSAVLGVLNGQPGQCVPFIIEKLLVYGVLWGTIWIIAFSNQGNRAEGWRSAVESIYALFPWLRIAIKYLAVARLAMALDALLNAGVPVVRAWELAAVGCGSVHLKREILRWTPELETGTTPGEMIAQIKYFPEMFVHLYQTGEMSGKLDESLTRLHTYFEQEGFRKLQAFFKAVNMVIYFSIVIAVAIYVLNFWMNYFKQVMNNI